MVASILSYLPDEAYVQLLSKYIEPERIIGDTVHAYRQRHVTEPLQKLIELVSRRGF